MHYNRTIRTEYPLIALVPKLLFCIFTATLPDGVRFEDGQGESRPITEDQHSRAPRPARRAVRTHAAQERWQHRIQDARRLGGPLFGASPAVW